MRYCEIVGSLSFRRSIARYLLQERRSLSEDARVVVVSRGLRRFDLERLAKIYGVCVGQSIDIQIELGFRLNGSHRTVAKNFAVSQGGIRYLLQATRKSEQLAVRQALAAAKSAGNNFVIVAMKLQEVLSRVGERRFQIRVFIRKDELVRAMFPRSEEGAGLAQLWIVKANFLRFVKEETSEFLNSVWVRKERMIILIGQLGIVRCDFCEIAGRPVGPSEHNTRTREALEKLLADIATDREALPFALALTLAPANSESRPKLAKLFGRLPDMNRLLMAETQFYDFKQSRPDGKDMTAFANACGGLIVCGVGPQGEILGCDLAKDPDRIADSVKDVVPTLRYRIVDARVNSKCVLAIHVFKAKEGMVHHLRNGERPFRYMSTTSLFAYDHEVLEKRAEICRGCG